MIMSTVPSWVADAIFYQIFPERFENGDPTNDPPNCEPWGSIPKPNNYFGGDLQGIINRLGYLSDLGINAIYLNPIFAAESNHKYNTKDYLTIDPSFGTNETFEKLLSECHKRNIRIVIDGVFNHVGTAHFAFRDVKENGRQSKYAAWFNIFSYPVSEPRHPNYECWWGHGALPKLMVQNPEVKKYLFDVTKFWTEKGIDGWRLDVPNELPHEFWKEWRMLIKSINPDCYIVGELWEDASPWLQGDEFDAAMNYRFRQACIDYFVHDSFTTKTFFKHLDNIRNSYRPECNYAMQNLLGSHDTERYLTLCKGVLWRMKLSILFQMTYIGAPMVYYGDEIGMEGGKDPDCRRCMVWEKKKWNRELYEWAKKLISVRNNSPSLRQGDFTPLLTTGKGHTLLYRRQMKNEITYVAINTGSAYQTVEFNVDKRIATVHDELSSDSFPCKNGTASVFIPAMSGRIFILKS
jgi:cyclomaltodextrinase